jgi:hypothetical protein
MSVLQLRNKKTLYRGAKTRREVGGGGDACVTQRGNDKGTQNFRLSGKHVFG